MRKFFFSILALTLSAGLWANQITYTAKEALTLDGEEFIIPVSSHAWSSDTQKGTITFDSDVTTITVNAFEGSKLISITLPGTITTIRGSVFYGCSNLTSITFEGVATSFASDAFAGAGTAQAPVTLILPEEWNYKAAPTDNQTAWYGGYFNSNIYSKQESTDKQAALDAITEAMGDYSESAYMQSLVAEYVTNITNATNSKTINTNKEAAIAILTPIVAIYPIAFSEGKAAGKTEAKKELLGAMGEPCTGCTAVEVTDGTTTVTLYKPTNVSYIKHE